MFIPPFNRYSSDFTVNIIAKAAFKKRFMKNFTNGNSRGLDL